MAFYAVVSLVFGLVGVVIAALGDAVDPVFYIYGLLGSYLAAPAFLVAAFFVWANTLHPARQVAHRAIAILLVAAFVARFLMALDLGFVPESVETAEPGSPLGFAPFASLVLTWIAATIVWFLLFGKRMPVGVRAVVSLLCAAGTTVVVALLTSSSVTVVLAAGAALYLAVRRPRRQPGGSAGRPASG